MSFVEGNHVIQKVAAATSHPALSDTVLPWAANRRADSSEPYSFYGVFDFGAKLCVIIENHVSLPVIVRKGFSQLLCDPATSGICGYSKVQDAAAIMADEEEAIQQPKGDGWNGEEVHGGDGFAMVVKKGFPRPCGFRAAWRPLNPAGHGSLGDVKTKLEQFAVDTGRTPKWDSRLPCEKSARGFLC